MVQPAWGIYVFKAAQKQVLAKEKPKENPMLNKIIPTGLAAVIFAAGLSLAAPAQAGGNVSFTFNGKHGSLTIDNGRRGNGHYKQKKRKHVSICKPRKAIRKARDIGVRNAHVDRVGRRFVIVKGRKRGSMVKVAFERRGRRCNIAWVDRTPIYYGGSYYDQGHGYGGRYDRHAHKRNRKHRGHH